MAHCQGFFRKRSRGPPGPCRWSYSPGPGKPEKARSSEDSHHRATVSTSHEDWRALGGRGGYPTPALELDSKDERDIWFSGYVKTYLERGQKAGGAILENIVLMDLMAWREGQTDQPEVSYWRTANGEEVDFVLAT